LDKQARNDSQLESWCVRLAQVRTGLVAAHKTLLEAVEQLDAESAKPDADKSNMNHLYDVILQQQSLIAILNKEHADLQDKITERTAKYGLKLQDMENFAFSIITVNDAWNSLQHTKDQIERTLNDLIVNER